MKKKLAIALGTATIAAIALPAFADHQIGGYFRTSFIMENLTKQEGKAADPDTVIDNRFRARWQNNINEYVSVVWFGEVDAPWGQQSKGAIGNGGKQGNDGVNVETKHAYLDVKIPGAPAALSTRLGLQAVYDNAFSGVVMNDDGAGLTVNGKMDMLSGTLGWFKFDEGTKAGEDDSDAYFLQAAISPIPGLKLMPEFWWFENKGAFAAPIKADTDGDGDLDAFNLSDASQYYLGLGAAFKVAMVDLSGWALYEFGEANVGGDNVDINGWAVSAKAGVDVAGAKVGLRAMYFPEQSDNDDLTIITTPNSNNGAFEFYDEGLAIFLADAFYMNTAGGRLALTDAAYAGYGLFGAVLNGSFAPPALKQLSFKGALGYFMATDDKPDVVSVSATGAGEKEGTSLGTELALSATYKVADKVDVTLRGAYAWLGDFYDNTAAGGKDPDDLYKLALTVNVPY